MLDKTQLFGLVKAAYAEANFMLPSDVLWLLKRAAENETSRLAAQALKILLDNACLASQETLPICQDTGYAYIVLSLGRSDCIDFDFQELCDKAVAESVAENGLRPSIVERAFFHRTNSGTNVPTFARVIKGNGKSELLVMARGGGSENATGIFMLRPTASREEIIETVRSHILAVGPNACPPLVVSIVIGGSAELALERSKHNLFLDLRSENPRQELAELEREISEELNLLGIGAACFGGNNTVLRVIVDELPCHIATLPLAVTVSCHALRKRRLLL